MAGTGSREGDEATRIELTYSTTGGISRAKRAVGTLMVCIIQVTRLDQQSLDVGMGFHQPFIWTFRDPNNRHEIEDQLQVALGRRRRRLKAAWRESRACRQPETPDSRLPAASMGKAAGDGQRLAVQNTAALGVNADTPTQRDTKQRPGKDRKGDASLLGDKQAGSFRTAEQYLNETPQVRGDVNSSMSLVANT
jgi:hypothetical protein